MQSRLLALLGITLCLSTQAQADPQRPDPFVGINVSLAQIGMDTLPEDTTQGKGIQFGVIYPNQRVYAHLAFQDWDEAETRVIAAHYDYLWHLDSRITAFVGIQGALADFDLSGIHQTEVYETGPGLGAQAGALWELGRGWVLETGLRYTRFQVDINSQLVGETRLESLSEGYLSLFYRSN
jgi:hypothetical protein